MRFNFVFWNLFQQEEEQQQEQEQHLRSKIAIASGKNQTDKLLHNMDQMAPPWCSAWNTPSGEVYPQYERCRCCPSCRSGCLLGSRKPGSDTPSHGRATPEPGVT